MDMFCPERDDCDVAALAPLEGSTVFVIDCDEKTRSYLEYCFSQPTRPDLELFPSTTDFLLKRRRRRSECVLLDAESGFGGKDTLEIVCAELPVIVMTRRPTLALAVRALQAGAIDFLEKPLRRDRVLASITRALNPRRSGKIDATRGEVETCDQLYGLTTRQRQILDLVMAGLPNKVIAADLALSQRTVENHRAGIMRKLGCKTLASLVKTVCGLTQSVGCRQ